MSARARIVAAVAAVLLIAATVWLTALAQRDNDRERQACTARGGTMVHTGTRMVPAGKAMFVPVPEYKCETK
jgi:hypothetical protein